MFKTIVGIDPGASNGGIAVLKKGDPVKTMKMPSNDDIKKLELYLKHIKSVDPDVCVFIEKVQMFGSDTEDNPGKKYRIQVMLANYERIISLLIVHNIQYVEVYPQSWQSTLKLNKKGVPKNVRKKMYQEYANNAFPELGRKVTLWQSDALCIIQAMLLKMDQYPGWITERLKNSATDLFN